MGLYERLRIDESEVGKTFGSRTQIGASFSLKLRGAQRHRLAVVECECGRVDVVQLKHRNRKCQQCKTGTHHNSKTSEFIIWQGMIQRCTNVNSKDFVNYGARGICVCQRWLDSFEAFLQDMGRRPTTGHSIDRYPNNNGNYEPTNCRWATASEQQKNKRPRKAK